MQKIDTAHTRTARKRQLGVMNDLTNRHTKKHTPTHSIQSRIQTCTHTERDEDNEIGMIDRSVDLTLTSHIYIYMYK